MFAAVARCGPPVADAYNNVPRCWVPSREGGSCHCQLDAGAFTWVKTEFWNQARLARGDGLRVGSGVIAEETIWVHLGCKVFEHRNVRG